MRSETFSRLIDIPSHQQQTAIHHFTTTTLVLGAQLYLTRWSMTQINLV